MGSRGVAQMTMCLTHFLGKRRHVLQFFVLRVGLVAHACNVPRRLAYCHGFKGGVFFRGRGLGV